MCDYAKYSPSLCRLVFSIALLRPIFCLTFLPVPLPLNQDHSH